MDITAFIRELLFSHDCVIVPGFGGFIGNYTPARIDKGTSTFFPPVKQISFNRNLNHNDGLLIGKISESAKVNYGDARNIVEEFVASTRKKLERGEKVVFDNIGTFVNNQEGNLLFEPDINVNYHLDSYGLESFQYPQLEGYDVRRRITRHIDKEPGRRPAMRKTLWRAAVMVPLLAILVAIPFSKDIFRSKVETTNLNPLVKAEIESNKEADKMKPEAEAESTKPEPVTVQPVTNAPETIASESYFLITGSFKLMENAQKQADILKKEGFTPEIISAPNGFYRVSAMVCTDIGSALEKKDSIKSEFPGAWVKKR